MSIEEWGPGKHSEKGNMAHIGIFKLGMCIFTHICIFYVYSISHYWIYCILSHSVYMTINRCSRYLKPSISN
jgi:hypothetical protein